jgi:hypothetical protein
MKKIILLFLLLMTNVQATTYLQINGVSLHDSPGFNEFNYGAGIEQTISDNWTIAAGWYKNSEYKGSAYTYGRYSFYKTESWDLGVGAGVVTGYKKMNVMPMFFPEACYKYICGIFLPKISQDGANALGFHLRLPIN